MAAKLSVLRRSAELAVGASLLVALGACSLKQNPDGSITIQSQTKYEQSSAVTKTSTKDAKAGDKIVVRNQNGDITVSTGSTAKIALSAVPFAFADKDKQKDAEDAMADLAKSITIDEATDGTFRVTCTAASKAYGSAANGTTGCGKYTVVVPAGVAIQLDAVAENGSMTATGITAGALTVVSSQNGDVNAQVTPSVGTTLKVSSGNGDVTLSLPKDFNADLVTIEAKGAGPKVDTSAFSDVKSGSGRGTAGTGAKVVEVLTENGDITLKAF